jgi:ABC-2 type transport system ATP-binding protein
MTEDAILTRGLHRRFGDKVAVAELSLAVRRGEIFGFLGPNGAGKTTSLKMLLGLIAPTAGAATVLGRPLGDRGARAKIGFLPEHFRFHDWMTGREMLRFHGRLYGLSGRPLERRIEALLERVDLVDAAHRRLSGYSKGMLQRVGLAQALLNRPDLLFLDEPTSGLDPIGRLLVRDIIGELRREGVAVFLNSHLLGEVEATCDRVVFVKGGRILAERRLDGPAEHLGFDLVVSQVTPALLAALGAIGTARATDEAAGRIRVDVAGGDQGPAIARAALAAGADLHALVPRRPSLEETFLAVMGDDSRPG